MDNRGKLVRHGSKAETLESIICRRCTIGQSGQKAELTGKLHCTLPIPSSKASAGELSFVTQLSNLLLKSPGPTTIRRKVPSEVGRWPVTEGECFQAFITKKDDA
jgi:hypothetical protein